MINFVCFFSYGQITPYSIRYNGIGNAVIDIADEISKERARYGDMAIDAMNSAVEAMDKKYYDLAISEFQITLEYLDKSSLKGTDSYPEIIERIYQAIEYCKYKKDNPYDNPYYKIHLGYLKYYSSFNDIYGYGSTDQLEFVIFSISNHEHILLKREIVDTFSGILKFFYEILNAPNCFRNISRNYKQFYKTIDVYYLDTNNNLGFLSKTLFISFEKNSNSNKYVIKVYDYLNNNLLVFTPEQLEDLKALCNILSNSVSLYNNSKKDKATDDDKYVILLNKNNRN